MADVFSNTCTYTSPMPWIDHRFFYTDHIKVPLPEGHRFPMRKYRLLREALLSEGILTPAQLSPSPSVDREDLLRAHTLAYVEGVQHGTLTSKEARPIGLPLTPELYERSLASVGGFVQSALSAMDTGFAAQLAGGTHHAFADRGEGFCVFNDFAVAALKLLTENKVKRILILDLDVHQGNGTSGILGSSQEVFIVSLHGERNYPFRKVPSHLDVPLPEGTGDEKYLRTLEETLATIDPLAFDIIFYQAGVDVLSFDSLGTFALSFEGVRRRDELVFEFSRNSNLPVAMAIGGGYSKPIENTITAHLGTFLAARDILK